MSNQQKYEYVTEQDYNAVAGKDWPVYSEFLQHNNIDDWIYQEIDSMLNPPEEFNHPSFCTNPFYAYEIPRNSHCCLLPKNHDIDRIRQEMLNGSRPVECNKCWKLEDQGLVSDRLIKNRSLDFWANIDIKNLYENCLNQNYELLHYKIDTSNRCNATCVTCGSHSSSAWNLLETKNNIIASTNWNIEKSAVDKKLNYKTAKVILFRGGESFLSNTNFEILQNLIDVGNTDCFVSFVTNGSVRPTTRQTQILQQFKNINFCFSIDGIGTRFEYIRFPLRWQTVEQNIKWAQDKKFDVSVSYTVSNLNILNHNENIKWFESNNIPFLVNPVNEPKCFSPNTLPLEIRKTLGDNELTEKSNEIDWMLWDQFKQEIRKQDQLKNISISDYLPEIADIIIKY